MKICGFKVKDRLTGLYLGAGFKWTKLGKIWTNIGHLKSAKKYHMKSNVPPNWELIALAEVGSVNADIVINGKMSLKNVEEMLQNKQKHHE